MRFGHECACVWYNSLQLPEPLAGLSKFSDKQHAERMTVQRSPEIKHDRQCYLYRYMTCCDTISKLDPWSLSLVFLRNSLVEVHEGAWCHQDVHIARRDAQDVEGSLERYNHTNLTDRLAHYTGIMAAISLQIRSSLKYISIIVDTPAPEN